MAPLPPAPVPVDCHWPLTTRGQHHNQPLPPPAPHDTAHGTPPIHWEALGRARLQPRMPTRIAAMSDSDGSPGRDDCHHRQPRSAPPSPQDLWGKLHAEREERQLAEAAVPVGPPALQPRAAPSNPEPPAPDPAPAGEDAPAAQTAAPTMPPPGGARDAQGAMAAAPVGHATACGTPLARKTGATRTPGALLGAATAAAESRGGAKYRAHTKPSHTHTSSPKPYPPKSAFPEGRPRPVPPPTPKRTPLGIRLPQRQRRVVEEGGAVTGAQGEERTAAAGG